jgi:hypothetical protein
MGLLKVQFVPKAMMEKVQLRYLRMGELFRFAGTHYIATGDVAQDHVAHTQSRRCVDVSENFGAAHLISEEALVTPATGRLLLDEED